MSVDKIIELIDDDQRWYFSDYQLRKMLPARGYLLEKPLKRTIRHLLAGYLLQDICVYSCSGCYFQEVWLIKPNDKDPDGDDLEETVLKLILLPDLRLLLQIAIDSKIYPYDQFGRRFHPEEYGLEPDFPEEKMIGRYPPEPTQRH